MSPISYQRGLANTQPGELNKNVVSHRKRTFDGPFGGGLFILLLPRHPSVSLGGTIVIPPCSWTQLVALAR